MSARPVVASACTSCARCATTARAMLRYSHGLNLSEVLFNNSSSETSFAVVEHDCLARRHSTLRLLESDEHCIFSLLFDQALLISLAVANLCRTVQGQNWWLAVDPRQLGCSQ